MSFLSVRGLARRAVYVPWVPIPEGRMVDLPGRGATYVTDTPGPHPDSPTVLLLHAVGCTGLLTWFPSIGALSERFRVVTMDQRWHGRGIQSEEFSLYDCADDAAALLDVLGIEQAIVVGFSMGSIVAQRVWRQHPDGSPGWCCAPRPTGSGGRRTSGCSTRAWSSRWSAPAASPGRVRRCARRARPPRRST